MVEVFKTDVREDTRARELKRLLCAHFPGSKVNFDLEDCDNVLRVEGDNILRERITSLLLSEGCVCESLE